MATQLDLTSFDAMLKELYPDKTPEHVATRNRPWLRMVNKQDIFEGDLLVQPVLHEFPAGRSATFATAQTNAFPSESVKFNLTRVRDYGNVLIDAETIRASRSNRGAFVRARQQEIDGVLMALGKSASIALYGSGSGSIGQIATGGIAGAVVTLTNADDVAYFGLNQVIVASTVDGGGAVKGGSVTVLSRDEDAGTVTFTVAYTTGIGTGAVLDFLFVQGDYDLKITGLAGWLPLVAPTGGDNHFGVDRSTDPTRLAGLRQNTPATSVEENILTLAEKIVRNGGEPDLCFINHTAFSNLVKGLGTKVEYQGAGGTADSGFRAVMIHTSAGMVQVIADPDCPPDRGYILTQRVWSLFHLDGFPHIDRLDGNTGLRQSAADGIEVRARYWAQLGCWAPAWNGVFAL